MVVFIVHRHDGRVPNHFVIFLRALAPMGHRTMGTFIPETFRSRKLSFPGLYVPGTFCSGSFIARIFRSQELSFQGLFLGTFIPNDNYSWELSFWGSCMFLLYCCSFLGNKVPRMLANAQHDGCRVEYRWCPLFNAAVLSPVFSASRVQYISDLHSKFALMPHHVCKYGSHPVCDLWD